jgi:hypothetical protein
MTAIELARMIHASGKLAATQLIVMTGSRDRSSATELAKYGALSVRRSVWRAELSKLFANFKPPENGNKSASLPV